MEKVVLCYRCKTRHMLGANCPVATTTTEDSGMSLNEQSDTPVENLAPAQPESSVKTQPSADNDSESGLESSAGPTVPLESPPNLPSQGDLSVVQRTQVNREQDSLRPGAVLPSKGDQNTNEPTLNDSAKKKNRYQKKENIEIFEGLSVPINLLLMVS